MDSHALLLLAALLLDWMLGDPDWLWKKIPHPVVGFGKAVGVLENIFNDDGKEPGASPVASDPALARRKGALVIVALIIAAAVTGLVFEWLISFQIALGRLAEILIIWILLAQKSLLDHVGAVALALREQGL